TCARPISPSFFSCRRRHTRFSRDWSSDVCSSDLLRNGEVPGAVGAASYGDCVAGHPAHSSASASSKGNASMHEVKAVVVKARNEPATVETILVPDPGPGEALVDVVTCGVCQTDLHYKVGAVGEEFPYLLGHEAAGVVAAVGDGVTEIAPGDRVILNWRAVCGQCRACRKGQLHYCFA